MSLKVQRLQLVKQLVEKYPAVFGYLATEPFVTAISTNYIQYPNQFLQAMKDTITQFGADYFNDVMVDDGVWGPKYREFNAHYIKCYQHLVEYQQQIQQQQQNLYYAQQQQQYAQGGFGAQNQQYISNQGQNYTGNQQTYTQGQTPYTQNQQTYTQGQQNYNQNYHQKQYYNQQGGTQQGHHVNQQQGGFNQQGQQNYRQNRNNYQNQGQNYQNQGGNYQQQGYNQQNQGSHYQHQGTNYQPTSVEQQPGQQQNRYQNANQQNRNPKYNNPQQAHYHTQQGHYNQGQQPHYNKYHQNRHHQNFNQNQQEVVQPVVEQKPKVEEVVAPKEPPKPVPKPMKFSLSQIRQFIGSWTDKNKQFVTKDLIEKVNEVNGWTKGQANFEQKPERPQQQGKYNKNDDRRRGGDRKQEDGKQQPAFATGSKYTKTPQVPQLQKKNTGLQIVVGKNQTLQSKKIKQEIKQKAGQDFATLMEKQNQNLGQLQLFKKQIIYNLNLLAPQNIADIKKDLLQFLFNDSQVCHILIEQIIQKAWAQPKYASTYAKLCSQFSKYPSTDFKFQTGKKQKKRKDKQDNPFKVFLISKVQHSFDKKVEQIPDFKTDQQKDKYMSDTKKKILGNVKFIAQLIRSKVLKKRIMKICISQLIYTFLAKYYYFRKTGKLIDSYFDYYFEALIEFIQNVGQFYQKMDENKEKQDANSAFEPAQRKVIDLIEMNQKPPEQQIHQINDLKADDYFLIFEIIDNKILKSKNSRLSALLLNLKERRANNWQKHHSQSDGPKKLKDIKQDIAKQEQQMNKIKVQKKQNMEHLHDLIKAMFKDWQSDSKTQKTHFKTILKQYTQVQFLTACLNQIADEKKQNVRKRVDLFDVILDSYFNLKNLKDAWFECIKYMAFNSGDYPFASAAIALVLKKILTRQPSQIKDFYYKTEDEDEQFFVNQVYGKLYFYSNWEEIKSLTTPSKKFSNMLQEKV